MSALERIQKEVEQWFLTEPLFFTVYCSHRLTINPNMSCALRSGQGRIEYHPELIDPMPDRQLRALLSVEMIRILLKHPYSRQPLGCHPMALKMASDMVIAPAYNLAWVGLTHPSDFGLPTGQHFEWYANRLNIMGIHIDGAAPGEGDSSAGGGAGSERNDDSRSAAGSGGGQGMPSSDEQEKNGGASTQPSAGASDESGGEGATDSSRDYTSLWEEDAFIGQQLTDIIQSTTQWGSLPGDMVELIKKAAEGKIDYRNALRAFRSSILSQKRHLTRMRPSRRFGFEQMGSHYDFTTRLLVAIDTSASVGSDKLGLYYRIITTFFKYGIQEIDVLMFDSQVQGSPTTLKEAQKRKQTFEVKGRGGTCFQAPVDYVHEHPGYDGLIILTDGYAPVPDVPAFIRTKLLWVIDNEISYKRNYDALRKTGRVCLIEV